MDKSSRLVVAAGWNVHAAIRRDPISISGVNYLSWGNISAPAVPDADQMSTHHPTEEYLVHYAAGVLPEAQAVLVAAHLTFCPACRATVRDAEALDFLTEATTHLESGLVVAQLAALQTDLGHVADAARSLDRYAELSPLLEPDVAKWLAARRAEVAYLLGDHAAAVSQARAVGEPVFTTFADRLEAASGVAPRTVLPLELKYDTTPPTPYDLLARHWSHALPNPPAVGVLAIADPEKIIRTAPTARPVVLAGDADGIVDAAAAGLLSGHEVVLYSASYADDPAGLRSQIRHGAALVLTDTNRRSAERWGTVRDNTGITERPGQQPMVTDWKDQRLEVFPDAGDAQATVTLSRGGAWADATSYGNSVSLTPEDNPTNAVDGDVRTAWRTGGFSSADGETLRITYRKPVSTDHLRLLQAVGGVRNRTISKVAISFDGGEPIPFDLDDASRAEATPADPEPAGQTGGQRSFAAGAGVDLQDVHLGSLVGGGLRWNEL